MIANYRVPADLTSIESTSDGNNIVLGMVDGNLTVLTMADPIKPDMKEYLNQLPSRTACRGNRVKTWISDFICLFRYKIEFDFSIHIYIDSN